MNIQSFKNRTGLVILVSLTIIILIYSIDGFKLYERLTGWRQFGETPIPVSQIRYFNADTPNFIGYTEPDSGERLSCATTVAYMRTAAGDEYRCCDSGTKISCVAGDFSTEIPVTDEACTGRLREIFGIPAVPDGALDFQAYGMCPEGRVGAITLAQVDDTGRILWKRLDASAIAVLVSALKCILSPLLFLLALGFVVVTIRGRRYQPVRRF
jgi:hypothetical protein